MGKKRAKLHSQRKSIMNNRLESLIEEALKQAKIEMLECIKILLYKKNNKIFEMLDFDDDVIYQEPLLYAFFNNKKKVMDNLYQIICCCQKENEKGITLLTDEFGKIYLPYFGWIFTNMLNKHVVFIEKTKELFFESRKIHFSFEEIKYIENTKIEILNYSIPLLKQCFYNVEGKEVEVEIENITKKHFEHLTKAYNSIKKYVPTQFNLIEKYAPKCVIFNVDTYQRNSFADITAHGIAFYNAYQEDYDEVFFVDDIAHQTGHVIFNTLLFKPELYFKINKNTILENIYMPDNETIVEKRNLFVIFHALYTYYTSLICLDACLSNDAFNEKQTHEAKGRISFYITKCYNDFLLIDSPINSRGKAEEYFTEKGLEIYLEIKELWIKMHQKWYSEVGSYDMINQPYNFTYSKFKELNPLQYD